MFGFVSPPCVTVQMVVHYSEQTVNNCSLCVAYNKVHTVKFCGVFTQENIHVQSVAKELAQTLSSVRHAMPGYTRDAVG